jgi:precorrin-3B synthase
MRRGWCPTVYAPMRSGDGLLVRVKPPCGRLRPAQARALAAAAARDGNGVIELTNRGNLQVRGLTEASVARFAAAMVACGLAVADPAAERRRNVALVPLADARTLAVAAELERRLAGDAALASLPGKFGFTVALPGAGGDVRLHPIEGGWLVWPEGAARAVPTAEPAADALRLAHAFLAVAAGSGRMCAADTGAVLAAAGLHATEAVPALSPPPVIGPLPGGFGVGLPFGAADAAALAALAELGTLHLTPWRAVIVESPSLPVGGEEVLRTLGLILDPADPRLALHACAGFPSCASAHAETRADAARLAALRPGIAAHLSGCAKGCAHPGPSAITLVAGPDGYALIRDGAAGDAPVRTALSLAEAAAMLAP